MNCVQLDPDQIKDVDLTPGHVTTEKANKVRDAFRDANLPIVAISAYTNLLAKDPEKRKANIAWVKELLAHARDFGTPYVVSETGTKFGDGGAEHNSFRGAGAVELPGAGLGVLNYELYLTRLKKNHPNIPIIIEHIDESDIPRAKKFVDDTLKKVGA